MMTITYPVKTGIYVNMTNRCPCACTFCLRHNGEGVSLRAQIFPLKRWKTYCLS